MKKLQYELKTKVATLYLVGTSDKLCGVYWEKQSVPTVKLLSGVIEKAREQLEEYLNGDRIAFDLPLEFKGTPFQEKVWKALQEIPYGKTISYGELALRIKNHKAVRAVGTANGKNPLSIIVPCHRVIASDGTLGGYAGGLAVKSTLLQLERTADNAPSTPRHRC